MQATHGVHGVSRRRKLQKLHAAAININSAHNSVPSAPLRENNTSSLCDSVSPCENKNPREEVGFSPLKVSFSAEKVTFSREKVTFSVEFSRELEAKDQLFGL